MAFLEIAGQRLPIPPGEAVVGSDPSASIQVEGAGVAPRHIVLHTASDGQVSVHRPDESVEILINGVRLGPQPTPLLHGDKIEIGGQDLLFVDERRSGSTQYVQAVSPAMMSSVKKPAGQRSATAATGGRLVSLTDGREYTITSSLVMGREAGCDVVVTSKSVSRRHAEIMPTAKGYLLVDSSTNGTYVNGQKIKGQHLLARADVIRVGEADFRFYADLASAEVAPPPPAAPGAEERLQNTLMGIPGAPRPGAPPAAPPVDVPRPPAAEAPPVAEGPPPVAASPPAPPAEPVRPSAPTEARPSGASPLAFLVIRSGHLKGQRLPIRVPVVNVGRADYNDLVVPDDSVSTVHAKFQRREGIWVVVDLDSTNGTYVDGERVDQEAPLAPGALVRFGEVRAFFEPADQDDSAKGGSTKLMSAIKFPTDR